MSDSVFALATAPGRAAVAIVRLSGPRTAAVVAGLAGDLPRPRLATLRPLRDGDGKLLDQALVIWFPGPASYTGEDCAELHLHGGPAVVDAVTRALLQAELRLAEPGEFTRRAFEAGKLDLAEAEAIGDLVDAESAGQARQALGQLSGALGRRYGAWREKLMDGLARLEAAVDFPDEEVSPDIAETARLSLTEVLADLDAGLADASRGRRVREGYRVAIVGAPNAGKSSLLNGLAGRAAAIVAPTAGTTRDIIEVALDIEGYRVVVADTAGLGAPSDPVEAEGVRRARAWARSADLRLWMVDRTEADAGWEDVADLLAASDACLLNKSDLPSGPAADAAKLRARRTGLSVLEFSATADAQPEIIHWLAARVLLDLSGGEFPAATRERHRSLLSEGRGHLIRALDHLEEIELAAEDVRLAIRALARISGQIGVEDVLGKVFASFCIGK